MPSSLRLSSSSAATSRCALPLSRGNDSRRTRPLVAAGALLSFSPVQTIILLLLVLLGILVISLLMQTLMQPHSNASLFKCVRLLSLAFAS